MAGTFANIQKEVGQDHSLRAPYLKEIEKNRGGRAIISFFISFQSQTPLSQVDADMIEEILVNTDTSRGVTLILDAPGGDGLAAERIIQVCKAHSDGDFETIVPSRAKSAATMVCLGSDRIIMSPTSELGPIDPQIPFKIGEQWQWVAAHHVIKTYDKLMGDAIGLTQGHIEPYLQQLSQFNATQIEMLRASTKLSESIAVSSLQKGMMNEKGEDEIKDNIKLFTDPEATLSHGRALNHDMLKDCGLNIELIDLNEELWKNVWNLYMRSKFVVDRDDFGSKLVETLENSYRAG